MDMMEKLASRVSGDVRISSRVGRARQPTSGQAGAQARISRSPREAVPITNARFSGVENLRCALDERKK